MIWKLKATILGDYIRMDSEYRWTAPYAIVGTKRDVEEQIDTRFIDIITNIAWKYGFNVEYAEKDKPIVKVAGEPTLYIYRDTRMVDFSEVPEEIQEEVAITVQDAMEKFEDWENRFRRGRYYGED